MYVQRQLIALPFCEEMSVSMGYATCVFCNTTSPESTFCTSCGKALKKWCPKCGDWKAASFSSLDVMDDGSGMPMILADSQQESKFCPDCGAELHVKMAAHE